MCKACFFIAVILMTCAAQGAVIIDCSLFSSMDLLDGGNCNVGDKFFSNISYSGSIDETGIGVQTLPSPATSPGLRFTSLSPQGVFEAPAGQSVTFDLSFTVTILNGFAYVIHGASLNLGGINNHSGRGTVGGSETFCVGAYLPACVADGGALYSIPIGLGAPSPGHAVFAPSGTLVDVATNLTLTGGSNTPTDLASIEERFEQVSAPRFAQAGVPEPMTILLTGLGLCLVGLARRRR